MSSSEERWEPADVGLLQVGEYIRIDHRWFDHPFTRRMFRIGSDKEIAIMRDVSLTRVFVDRNNPAPGVAAAAEPVADAAAPAPPVQPAPHRALAAQREALKAAQARDRVTQERAVEVLGMLGAGDPGSATAMAGYIDYLVAILNNSTTPLAPMAPAAQRRSMTRLALLGSDAVWLAGTIGKRMRLDAAQLRLLTMAAAGHAVGLARMPPYLMDEEAGDLFVRDPTFRNYPVISAKILKQCGGFAEEVLRIVLEHRERPDGTGFPRRLKGEAIHPLALILGAVREVQLRCAGGTMSPAVVLANNYRMLREVYGAEIANQLAASLLIFPVGTYVQLSDGSVARILRINESARLSPVVETYGPNATLNAPETVDLSRVEGLVIVRALDTSRLPPRIFESGRASRAASARQAAAAGGETEAAPPATTAVAAPAGAVDGAAPAEQAAAAGEAEPLPAATGAAA